MLLSFPLYVPVVCVLPSSSPPSSVLSFRALFTATPTAPIAVVARAVEAAFKLSVVSGDKAVSSGFACAPMSTLYRENGFHQAVFSQFYCPMRKPTTAPADAAELMMSIP